MHFLCDAIDLKQQVEGTLKVLWKSLTTAVDEIHFAVNLYSFPYLWTQGKTFFPQGKSFAPSQVKQIPKLSLSFYVNLSFLRYLNSQGRIKKMVNSLDYTLLFQD